jgi:hypothetical protein
MMTIHQFVGWIHRCTLELLSVDLSRHSGFWGIDLSRPCSAVRTFSDLLGGFQLPICVQDWVARAPAERRMSLMASV